MSTNARVTVWSEYRHEKKNPSVAKIYPEGIHGTIAQALSKQGFTVRTATLDEPQHGLSDEVLSNTDVLTWWGHMGHHLVSDDVVADKCANAATNAGCLSCFGGFAADTF